MPQSLLRLPLSPLLDVPDQGQALLAIGHRFPHRRHLLLKSLDLLREAGVHLTEDVLAARDGGNGLGIPGREKQTAHYTKQQAIGLCKLTHGFASEISVQ